MTPAERESFKKWLKGIPYEVSFWNSYYGHKPSLRDLDSWGDYGKECNLENFDIKSFAATCGPKPLFIDLGCALSYTFGTHLDGYDVTIDRVDPLAAFYNRILERHAPERPRIKFGMLECASAFYDRGSVDLIQVRNALDHSANPMQGVEECLRCLRVGGVLYLNHHRNEANRENYRGFHQYNIDVENGCLIIWNRSERINLNDALKGFATVECSDAAWGNVAAVVTKTADMPDPHPQEARARAMEMLGMALEAIHSPAFVARYNMVKFTTAAVHPVMRRIPRRFVDGLKKIMSRKK